MHCSSVGEISCYLFTAHIFLPVCVLENAIFFCFTFPVLIPQKLRPLFLILVRLNPRGNPAEEDIIPNTVEEESAVDSDTSYTEEEWTLELYHRLNRNKESFEPTNFGCFVCLENFRDKNKYDDHIQIHKEFKKKERDTYGLLELTYTLGPNSNKLRFKITSYETNIVIERVILVLEGFHYVNLHDMPYDLEDGM